MSRLHRQGHPKQDRVRSGRGQVRNACFAVAALAASLGAAGPSAAEPIRVAVSILPQAYFVQRLGGDLVEVQVMVGPGESPHTYDPTARQWARLAEASLFMATGVHMENLLLPRIRNAFPGVRIVDTTEGLPRRTMDGRMADEADSGIAAGSECTHAHGSSDHAASGHSHDGHDHSPESLDPHVWLSPRLAGMQAQRMAEALIEADPEHAEEYRLNLEVLQGDLEELDQDLAEALAPLEGAVIFAFHPAYGYLASEYGLTQIAIEERGLDPGPRHLAEVIEQGRRQGVRAVFVQPQFSQASAQRVAREIGAEVVVLDPLAPDYLESLRAMAETIRRALRP